MMHYTLVLELTSPLAVSMRRQANVIPTLNRVGPSMVRGALAGLALRTVRAEDDRFQQAFVQGGVRTSSLLPLVVEGDNQLQEVDVIEAPQTLMTCKRVREHGYIDGLFATTHYALLNERSEGLAGAKEIQDRIKAMESIRECPIPDCESVLKAAGGQLSYDWDGVFDSTGSPGKRLQTHVGLERDRRGAAQGVLYSREVINESTDDKRVYIQASVSGEDALMKWLSNDVLKKGTTLHIGNAISRGLGRCTVVRFKKAVKRSTIKERVEGFKEQFVASTKAEELLGDRYLISLMLDTPRLFCRPLLAPQYGTLRGRPGSGVYSTGARGCRNTQCTQKSPPVCQGV